VSHESTEAQHERIRREIRRLSRRCAVMALAVVAGSLVFASVIMQLHPEGR
jgi:hypoxanthine-guanine phosphoribosyltransferase